jgi:hypothetical protein
MNALTLNQILMLKPFIGIKFVYESKKDKWGAIASYKKWKVYIPFELLNIDDSIPIYRQKSKVYAALLHMLSLPCLSRK